MDDQQRARELLAAEMDQSGRKGTANKIRQGRPAMFREELRAITAALRAAPEARPLDDWHEDHGPVVWWAWDSEGCAWMGEPAWIGAPGDSDWPGYHTHWTPHPAFPAARPQGVKDAT